VVLLVEDDPATREVYRFAFRNAGFVVTAVEDGIDALRRIESDPPDAVVLDIALPRLGGREVLKEMRARPETRGLPVVIVTGTDVSDFIEGAGTPVLKKPVDPDDLVAMIATLVRRLPL
jgi:two-component system phosphate regulon response regulator PhoB